MASTIITKNSSTASAVPASGDLTKGELAVNVTDKKLYTKDNSGTVVKVVGSLGNQEASAAAITGGTSSGVAITGGTINNTPIGATTAAAVTGTLVTATTNFAGNLVGDVTGNTTGSHTGAVTGDVTGNLTGNVTASTGTSSFNDVTINGGLNMNAGTSATITNLTAPTNANDAATKSYVDTSISNLVASAPTTLDTLNEIAAALGNDPNLSATLTTSIAAKLPLAGGTMSGNIAMGSNKVTGLGTPSAGTDATTKTYVDTADALALPKAGGTMSGAIAMGTNKITGMGDPSAAQDAATKNYVDGILGSATSAATSAAAAATSATNAANSASSASSSASAASASASAAAASYDDFDDRYLGSKSSAPSVDNDGNALLTGALYWNTSSNTLYVWTGSTWTQAAFTASGFATLTGTETLTNKTLQAPNITSGLTLTGSAGTSGQFLTSAGTGAAPTWSTVAQSGVIQAVASGTLSNGTLIALNPDGTVSPINSTNATNSGQVTFTTSTSPGYICSAYDATNAKVVVFFRDAIGGGGYAVVGTVTGTTISFGTPVLFNNPVTAVSCAYDSVNSKLIVVYYDSTAVGVHAAVGTISGTTISFGSRVAVSTTSATTTSCVYDSTNQKIVVAYNIGTSSASAIVGTVSGTSISFGTAVSFSAANTSSLAMTFAAGKVVIAYQLAAAGNAIVGTVSGTSISFGTATSFISLAISRPLVVYDTVNARVVITYIRSTTGQVVLGTISGTSISFNTPVIYNYPAGTTSSYPATTNPALAFYPDGARIVMTYISAGSSDGTMLVGQIYGGNLVLGTAAVFTNSISGSIANNIVYDSTNKQMVNLYLNSAGSNGISTVTQLRATSLTSSNYIGISNAAYSHGATATIQVEGSIDDAQSGLIAGTSYYVTTTGTLSPTPVAPSVYAGSAINSTNLLITESMPATNALLINPTITNYTETTYVANSGTSILVDVINGTLQIITLTGNPVISLLNPTAGKSLTILLKQDATGSRTVTWSGVNWPNGTAPTITSTALKMDKFIFTSDGTNWYGSTAGQNYTV